ncbi:conserved hypothetical protein [Ricinus communis]|uniref:Uncharacterized protein n=1 Tax=Ricinus communis TaxID=3988 RepID=B9RH22_RICCO|nr:conserved hypothetical protein [Ricinus communis]
MNLSFLAQAQDTSAQEDIKWCPKKDIFAGEDCGNNGSYQCLLDFLGKYGASSMPRNCRCQSLGPKTRSCNCEIVCHQPFDFIQNPDRITTLNG